ncbi:MAG: hypothetical protein HNEKOMLI_00329 [Sodalis sp. Psp]|nr:hypothetical protein [Sodalis sp. Psp]MCR3756823.1 hypothetical protein [Sodalis sp. Ppy]
MALLLHIVKVQEAKKRLKEANTDQVNDGGNLNYFI